MAVGLTREESKRSFVKIDIIDADKNGEISFEEFMKAAEDFYRGNSFLWPSGGLNTNSKDLTTLQ